MDERDLQRLLEEVKDGHTGVSEALERLRQLPYEDLEGFARLDHHRAMRRGFPEVVFGQGKTPEQVARIMLRLSERNRQVMATRVTPEMYAALSDQVPEAVYHPAARLLIWDREPLPRLPGVVVATGGTADIPVAEEAALTAEVMGNAVERLYDVGVAGLHRLLDKLTTLQNARVLVVVAGMEGALASVIAGLAAAPVIAVPTSVGYGASFGGLAALLAMLNSCSTGISVVNIDNGFGAGYLAAIINRMGQNPPENG